jgi:hypothetical protein
MKVLFVLTSVDSLSGTASATSSCAAEAAPLLMDSPIAASAATMIFVTDIDTPSLLFDTSSATAGVDAAGTVTLSPGAATGWRVSFARLAGY